MKIRLLHILWEGLGGAQRIVLELARHLDFDKYDLTVAILSRGGCVTDLIDRKKVRVHEFGCRTTTDICSMRAVYAFLYSNQFEIIHNHEALFLLDLALMKMKQRSLLVYQEHGGALLSGSLRIRLFYAIFSKFYDGLIAIHKGMTQYMKRASMASAGKTIIIENPVDVQYFTPSIEPKRKFTGSNNYPTIGMVGRFVFQKDLPLFFETARLVVKRRPDIKFVIVGDGPLWSKVKSASNNPDFKGRIAVVGASSEIPRVLRSFDLFLFTSRIEPFGMTLIESLACGVPVLAALPEKGGARDLLKTLPGISLVERRTPDALADSAIALLDNPNCLHSLGQAGRRYIIKHYSVENWIKELDAFYDRLLKKRQNIKSSLD